MLRDEYVPVAVDDWYYRRKRDAEGEFFWKISGSWGSVGDGETRQQLTCVTARGRVLSKKNEGQFPAQVRDRLRQSLVEFKSLPKSERAPRSAKVEALKQRDQTYLPPTPSEGSLILKVYTRGLDRNSRGELTHCNLDQEIRERAQLNEIAGAEYYKAKEAPQPDRLWITQAEWKSLVPANPKKGASFPLPESIVKRLCQYHLFDDTWGLPLPWGDGDTRSARMILTIQEVSPAQVLLHLEGEAVIANASDPSKAGHGYQPRVLGSLCYDRKRNAFTRFDLVAVGDHWDNDGSGAGRRGRHPLGIAIELAKGDSPQDRLPPDTTRGGRLANYLGQ